MRTFRSYFAMVGLAALASAAFVTLPVSAGATTGTWTGVELRPLNQGESTFVEDINSAGTSVGNSGITAVRWDSAGIPTALPVPVGCTQSYAFFINDKGDIAGPSECGAAQFVATTWHPDGTLTLGISMFVSGFNNSDTVAGEVLPEGTHAVVHTPGDAPRYLVDGGAAGSHVRGLTNTYLAVGSVKLTDPATGVSRDQAVGWYGPYVFPFINDTTDNSWAGPANDAGDTIVTIDPAAGGTTYSVIVVPGGRVISLPDGKQDEAGDINNPGVAIGTHTRADGSSTPALFAYGSTVPLSDLLSAESAIDPQGPVAINDSFWIVGHGVTPTSGSQVTSWLMRPPT